MDGIVFTKMDNSAKFDRIINKQSFNSAVK
jgi:hypothetical protein